MVWDEGFPKGYGHTSIAYLKRCPGFEDAKKGNIFAARSVVGRCIKENRLLALREKFSDAALLPVLSNNALPLALAQAIGLPIWEDVCLLHTIQRKNLRGFEWLIHKPRFSGYVKEGMAYILVDDVITQGGTIAALRKHVISHGGKVVAVVALAYAIGSHDIAPTKSNIECLKVRLRHSAHIFQAIGLVDSFEELTNAQVKYLLRFSSFHKIERVLARHFNLEVGNV